MGIPLPAAHPPTIETGLSPEVQCFVGTQTSLEGYSFHIYKNVFKSYSIVKATFGWRRRNFHKKAKTVYKER